MLCLRRRSLGGTQADFARQLAERNRAAHPQKKFKTSAPKGARLATGYVDRSAEREELADSKTADDREKRLKALEESLKKEEIDRETFEKLRFQIAGGDLESTHLVKGLDFKLLERIRRGEDVYGQKENEPEAEDEEEPQAEDVDDEFDELEKQNVEARAKDQPGKKKGQLSTVSLAPGKKRTRDQILADLKASREAAKAQQGPALGDRFRKVGVQQKAGSRIEIDRKGREVLIIVDEDGHEKRKVRKVQATEGEDGQSDLMMPEKGSKPLGMEVPEQYRKQPEPEEEEDVDIFDDVGDDYDPLAGMDASDSDSEDDEEAEGKPGEATTREDEGETEPSDTRDGEMPPPPKPATASNRNYFQGAKTGLVSEETHKAPDMSDPAMMAAIKRAAALNPMSKEDAEDDEDKEAALEKKAREERHRKMLQSVDRDEEDLDMGFGTSRMEDEEDFEEKQVKLSKWGQEGDGNGDGEGSRGQAKRKRGPKKRKGDGNNAEDVMRVLEQRKK